MAMKRKKIYNILFAAMATTALLSSCAGDDAMGEGYSSNRDKLSTPTASVEFAGTETESSFTIESNGAWEISGMPDWFTVDPTSGVGNATVRIRAIGVNPYSYEARSAQITIKSDNKTNTIQITQKASPFSMTVDFGSDDDTGTLAFGKDDVSVSKTFTVTSNCNWQLGVDASAYDKWFTVSPTSGGVGSTTVTVTNKMKNNTEEPFSVDLVIEPDNTVPNATSQIVHVSQKGIETSFSLDKDQANVKAVGGSFEFKVQDADNNSRWEAQILSDISGWIRMSKEGETAGQTRLSGIGAATIKVEYDITNQQAARTARIVVSKTYDSNFSKTLAVSQAGANAPEIPDANIVITPHKHSATVMFKPVSDLPVSDCLVKYKQGNDEKTLACSEGDNGYYTVEIPDLTSMTTYKVCCSAKNNVGSTTTDYKDFTTTGGVPGDDDTPIPGLSNKRK